MFFIPENTILSLNQKEFSILGAYSPHSFSSCWLVKDAQDEKYLLKIFDLGMPASYKEKILQGLSLLQQMPSLHILPILHLGLLPHQDNQPLLENERWKEASKTSYGLAFALFLHSSLAFEEVLQKEHDEETKIDYALQLCLAWSSLQKREALALSSKHPYWPFLAEQIFLFSQGKKLVLKIAPFDLGSPRSQANDPEERGEQFLHREQSPFLGLACLLDRLCHNPSNELTKLLDTLRNPLLARDPHFLGRLIQYFWQEQKRLAQNRRAYSLFLLGVNLCNQGLYKYALDDFQNAFALNPLLMEALVYEGYAWQSLGKSAEALEIYADVLSRGAGNAFLYENRAQLYAEAERYDEAISDLQKAISLKEDAASAYGLLGTICATLGKWLEALDAFSRVISLEENFASAYVDRGDVLAALGEREKALFDYEKALTLDSTLAEVRQKIAALKK